MDRRLTPRKNTYNICIMLGVVDKSSKFNSQNALMRDTLENYENFWLHGKDLQKLSKYRS